MADKAIETLSVLRERYRVALLSDNTDILRSDLRQHGLDEAFDFVFISCELGMTKPAPALYRHVAATMGTAAQHILAVDDLADNLPGAACVGMRVIQFTGATTFPDFIHDQLL